MRINGRVLAGAIAVLLTVTARADEHRASVNYKIHCQGCHLADGSGLAGAVPRLKGFASWFLHSGEGREFLIRVPGVATASLPDDELAELMNWLLLTFSAEEVPDGFEPYSAAEVAALRIRLVADPAGARARILDDIAGRDAALAAAIRRQQQ